MSKRKPTPTVLRKVVGTMYLTRNKWADYRFYSNRGTYLLSLCHQTMNRQFPGLSRLFALPDAKHRRRKVRVTIEVLDEE